MSRVFHFLLFIGVLAYETMLLLPSRRNLHILTTHDYAMSSGQAQSADAFLYACTTHVFLAIDRAGGHHHYSTRYIHTSFVPQSIRIKLRKA